MHFKEEIPATPFLQSTYSPHKFLIEIIRSGLVTPNQRNPNMQKSMVLRIFKLKYLNTEALFSNHEKQKLQIIVKEEGGYPLILLGTIFCRVECIVMRNISLSNLIPQNVECLQYGGCKSINTSQSKFCFSQEKTKKKKNSYLSILSR